MGRMHGRAIGLARGNVETGGVVRCIFNIAFEDFKPVKLGSQ